MRQRGRARGHLDRGHDAHADRVKVHVQSAFRRGLFSRTMEKRICVVSRERDSPN